MKKNQDGSHFYCSFLFLTNNTGQSWIHNRRVFFWYLRRNRRVKTWSFHECGRKIEIEKIVNYVIINTYSEQVRVLNVRLTRPYRVRAKKLKTFQLPYGNAFTITINIKNLRYQRSPNLTTHEHGVSENPLFQTAQTYGQGQQKVGRVASGTLAHFAQIDS